MRRVLAVTFVLAAAAAYVLTSGGAGKETGSRYTIELDNAFGLVQGGDVKVAGVRAGKVSGLRVDRRSKRALVDIEITRKGFGSLRDDAFCESRPQSLIGEYFVDCRPGTSPRALAPGGRIPVERTASTIPVDLINNILRRPYRERLRIILNELGAGVGGRADDLNAAIRRGSPALRETDRVLSILARQNNVLRDLTENADTVVGDLAGNRKDVGRWVKETEDAATASAQRRDDIAAGLRRLPGFLSELTPTMAELGRTADAQAPSLRNLNASAGQLERFLTDLGPFAESSRLNIRSLAKAADAGRPAVRAARPVVEELTRTSEKAPELAKNLAMTLADLDDRDRAVEPDKRSPGGKGYTGFEAFLQYVFDQAMAINIFDANGYMLKVNLSVSECSEYQNAESLKKKEKESPGFIARCLSALGPNQPGVTTPDPTKTAEPASAKPKADKKASEKKERPSKRQRKLEEERRKELRKALEKLLGNNAPELPDVPLPSLPELPEVPGVPAVPAVPAAPGGQALDPQALLDYLLAP
jgi:virulence factor Mce-like protein